MLVGSSGMTEDSEGGSPSEFGAPQAFVHAQARVFCDDGNVHPLLVLLAVEVGVALVGIGGLLWRGKHR
jgi:hypothetical protein